MLSFVLIGAFAASANADILQDNTSPTGGGYVIGRYDFGDPAVNISYKGFVPFTVGSNYVLTSVGLVASSSTTNQSGPLDLSLYSDSGGQPGALLEAWLSIPVTTPLLVTRPSAGNVILHQGQRYWFAATTHNPLDQAIWWIHDPGASGNVCWTTNGGPYNCSITPNVPAFQIQGSPVNINIDVKPGTASNPINTSSQGSIPVAILSSATFNAPLRVDTSSLRFGRTGNEQSLTSCDFTPEDVNKDGYPDLVCHFNIQQTGFLLGDTAALLSGKSIANTPMLGMDSVVILH